VKKGRKQMKKAGGGLLGGGKGEGRFTPTGDGYLGRKITTPSMKGKKKVEKGRSRNNNTTF